MKLYCTTAHMLDVLRDSQSHYNCSCHNFWCRLFETILPQNNRIRLSQVPQNNFYVHVTTPSIGYRNYDRSKELSQVTVHVLCKTDIVVNKQHDRLRDGRLLFFSCSLLLFPLKHELTCTAV